MFVPIAVNIDNLESMKPGLECEEPLSGQGRLLKVPAAGRIHLCQRDHEETMTEAISWRLSPACRVSAVSTQCRHETPTFSGQLIVTPDHTLPITPP